MNLRERMTDDQIAVLESTVAMFERELETCIAGMTAAIMARKRLPCTNTAGKPVVHGCNMTMKNIEDYWSSRFNTLLAVGLCSNGYQYEMQQRFHDAKEKAWADWAQANPEPPR